MRRALLGIVLAGLAVVPSATALPGRTVKARTAFFGRANVDRQGEVRRDRVVVSWFGVSSLAASFRGRVVLLDTFINNAGPGDCTAGGAPGPAKRRYVPATYGALAALRPEAIFIGHGHFDHECRTGELAARTGAAVVALPQDCAQARQQAVRRPPGKRGVRCVPTLGALSPFGAAATLRPLGRRVRVTVVRNLHSGLASGPLANDNGAESELFRFRVGRFSLVWNDSAGPLREQAPAVLTELRRLAPADVQFGASLGLGIGQQGFRDAVDYADALDVKRYYPLHQDLGSVDGSSRSFKPQLRSAFAGRSGLAARVRWLQDPGDYLTPITFDPTAARWRR